jgi:putative iron-dependent peroxidase
MSSHQPGILEPLPALARHLVLQLESGADPRSALLRLADQPWGSEAVMGLGPSAVSRLGSSVPGLREPPVLSGPGVSVPVTPAALWLWLRGSDRGALFHRSRKLLALLSPSFRVQALHDTFLYDQKRDLTGYEDGTENPTGEAAAAAALVSDGVPGREGSSFAALQLWQHDLQRFESFSLDERDALMGRRRSDNEELEAAPITAHVKRAAQESFEPPAFLLRRSMPWLDGDAAGLLFLAFGHSLTPFEAILRRMVGAEDGAVDGLFQYSRPVSTAYFWCPPVRSGQLDLSALQI